MIVLLFGAPGTGKSTYARYLAEKTGSRWVSTGGLLRDEAKRNDEIRKTLESGQLVTDEKVDQILFAKLEELECDFVLDGYPRTLQQMGTFLKFLADRNCKIDKIFHLSVPVEIVVGRVMARGRADDTAETIKDRFEVFEKETREVIERFEGRGIPVTEIDNSPSIEEVKRQFDNNL